jgi:hypothetical protein
MEHVHPSRQFRKCGSKESCCHHNRSSSSENGALTMAGGCVWGGGGGGAYCRMCLVCNWWRSRCRSITLQMHISHTERNTHICIILHLLLLHIRTTNFELVEQKNKTRMWGLNRKLLSSQSKLLITAHVESMIGATYGRKSRRGM